LWFIALILATTVWIFRPHFHADPALIDPRLRALEKPYQQVNSGVIFDGGSVAITIKDARGQTAHFFIGCDSGWTEVFIRPNPRTNDGAVPATNHAATIQELAAILADHCDGWEDYHNLEKMTGRLGDKLRTFGSDPGFYLERWWRKLKS
jgi:hypothetical protein